MKDVAVAMPWRAAPSRVRAYERVRRFWTEEMGLPLVTASSGKGPFNRSRARNNAVRHVQTPIVVVADADVLPDPLALEMALMDGIGGEVCWLYDEYRIIDPAWTDMDEPRKAPRVTCFCGQMLPHCCGAVSGLFVCRTETYWRLGGHDERFGARWGGEDVAFGMAANTLAGVRRVHGLAVAFDHANERDVRNQNPLLELYEQAEGDPDTMEWMVADPGRGHPAVGVPQWKMRWPSPDAGVAHWPPRPEGVPWL